MILETLPSKTARIKAPSSVVILTPLLKVSIPLRTGCACTPKRSIITPRSTGQGSFPLLEVKMASVQIANLKQQIQETQQSIVTQQELLDTLKSEYALMIRHAYFNRNAYDRLAFVFSSQ